MARFRSISNSFLLLTACSILPLQPATATPATAEGAAAVESMVESYLAYLKESLSHGGAALETGDTVLVEPTDNYYAVTLPSVRYVDTDGDSVELGMISLNAMPGAADGEWKMTMALPTPISLYNADGVLQSLVTIGGQNFAGIWHEDAQSFSRMNGRYENVAILDSGHNTVMKTESITVISEAMPGADGLWSGPLTVSFNNTTAGKPAAKYMQVGQFEILMDMTNASMDFLRRHEERMNALLESAEADGTEERSSYHALGFYNLATEYFTNMADDMEMRITVKDVTHSKPDSGQDQPQTMKLANGQFGMAIDGLRTDSASWRWTFSYDGLEMPEDERLVNRTPEYMNIDLSFNNLPLQKIIELGRNSLQVTAQAPYEQVANMAFITAMMSAPQILSEAGSNLTISQSRIGNDHYDIFIDGKFVADIQALFSATGEGTLRIRGIEAIMESVRSAMNAPDIPEERQEKLQKTLEMLTVLQIASQKEKAANGVTTHVYNLALTKEGTVTLNGTDLSALLQR